MNQPLNPYAPPQEAQPQLKESAPAVSRFKWVSYRSAAGKARIAMILAGAVLAAQLLMVGSFVMQLRLLFSADGGTIDPVQASANDQRHLIVSLITVGLALAELVTLLVWVYAATANLPALQARDQRFSPGWSVGCFFVPIVNLFQPCQVMFDLWNESDPRRWIPPHATIVPERAGALVGWWWGLRIVSAISGRILATAGRQADSIEALIGISQFAILLTLAIDVPMHILQILMIRRIQKAQDERNVLIEKQDAVQITNRERNPFAV